MIKNPWILNKNERILVKIQVFCLINEPDLMLYRGKQG